MRKLICMMAVIATGTSFAQTISEAVQYSSSNIIGTARYRAMGGAFGSLGGDLSAIGDNPAGSAVFTRGTASFTLSSNSFENNTDYFGESTNVTGSDFALNQVGGVFIVDGDQNSKWNKISFGFNYDRTGNFDNAFVAQGFNPNSISEYFSLYAQGIPLEDLDLLDGETVSELYQFLGEDQGFGAQQALLGYQSYILDADDPFDPNNSSYFVNTVGSVYNQEYIYNTSGSTGKASFNIGAQYNDDLYLGLNLNSHSIDIAKSTVLFESNDAGAPPAGEGFTNVTDIRFENNLRTLGSGFSFQLGAISKVGENVRLGLTYDSPTWYTISEENSQRIRTLSIDDDGSFTTDINPSITNVYQDYELKTPAKYTGSISYLFGTQGLISFDYSRRNFKDLMFRPENETYFNSQNDRIRNELDTSKTYKLGGEYRSNEWSLRGGYRLVTSPYENEEIKGDLRGYSLGLGYNFGQFKVDVAYDHYSQDKKNELYQVGLIDQAAVNRSNSSVVGTLTLSL